MLTRKIGKLIRGKTTPFQLFVASLLGTAIGFVPGFEHAPGLVVALVVVLLVLNANLFVAALAAVVGKVLGLLLLGTSFGIGRAILDGGGADLFRGIVNAPVLRYFGFEHYAVTGGLVLGLVVGALLGVVLAMAQMRLRRAFASLDEGSERYQAFTSKGWVKVLGFLFVGKRKKSWDELGKKKVGLPVRPLGIVGVAVLAGGAYAADSFLSSTFVAGAVQKGLERANGATVDLEGFQLSPRAGRLAIDRLAMADRLELSTDLFRGLAFDADLSLSELLRGRVVVDRLAIREARSGASRETPGEKVGPDPPSEEEDDQDGRWTPDFEELDLEEVLAEVEQWKETLGKVQRLLGRLAGDAEEPPGDPADATWRERLEQRARDLGYAEVVATHLLEREPRVLVRELVIEDFRFARIGEHSFDLRVANLSSAPSRLDQGVQLSLSSRDDALAFTADLGTRPSPDAARRSTLSFTASGLEVDRIASGLAVDGQRLASGGTLDVSLEGGFDARAGTVDLPLEVVLSGTQLAIPRVGETLVERFALPIGVRGPIGSPLVSVDDEDLASSLMAAGKQALADRVRAEADRKLAEARAKLRAELEARYGEDLAALGLDLDSVTDVDQLDALAREHLGVGLGADAPAELAAALQEEVESAAREAVDEAVDEARSEVTEQAGEVLGEALEGLSEGELPDLESLGEGKLEGLEGIGEEAAEKLGDKLGGLFGKKQEQPAGKP